VRPRPWMLATGVVVAVLAGIVAWASFWPDPTCSDPACATARFRLIVELDTLQGTDTLPLQARGPDGVVSVQRLLADGGVDLDLRVAPEPLPYDPSAGALDAADLHAYADAWSARVGPATADGRVYALGAPALRSPEGTLLFGVLFDHEGRGGVAVAPALTRQLFTLHHADAVPLLQMRTLAHELLHALNRHHVDAMQSPDRRLTVEAPTHCIADTAGRDWRLREPPLWALSPTTIRYFQAASPREVLPGRGHSPFDVRRGSARECDVARRSTMGTPRTRFELVRDRLFGVVPFTTAEAAEVAEVDSPEAGAATAVALRVEAQDAPYPLGFPVIVRVHATNTGETPVRLVGRLSPAYGVVTIETRRAGEEAWTPFRPLSMLEPVDDPRNLLPPGEHIAERRRDLLRRGRLDVRRSRRLRDPRTRAGRRRRRRRGQRVLSIAVAEPTAAADVAALEPLLGADGSLDPAAGRFFALHGRVRDPDVRERLESVAHEHGATALGAASRLVVAAPAIRAPIDPATGRRASPDLGAAREALERACVDSGLVAVGSGLLESAGVTWPRRPEAGGDAAAEAWEGIRTVGARSRLRYGDPTLARVGSPVAFAWNRSALDPQGRRAVRRLASTLRRSGATSVLVAGHADASGTCRGNLAVGLSRADAVARELVRAGVPRWAIEVVSLGSQRPLDFAASEAAARANRRVEIWAPRPLT
jgi:outer membrane protein OmpA-like peptidoglycan-associated protein